MTRTTQGGERGAGHGADPVRLLSTLERLLVAPVAQLDVALAHAVDLIAEVLGADKVDAFLYEHAIDTLVALGTSSTPLGSRQRELGLHRIACSNGGRTVEVYQTGQPHLDGRVDEDMEELRGVREGLGVRSSLGVPLVVNGERRGVLLASSRARGAFSEADLGFLEAAGRWVGVIAHHAELVEELTTRATEEGRRAAADEIVTVLAHDLRNQLAPLAGRVELLRRRAAREGRSADIRDAERVLEGISGVQRLVSDLLDVARLEHGLFALSAAPFDLLRLLEESARALSSAENEVHVRAVEPVRVVGDERRLRQVFDNLLSNAVRYSPPGAEVLVELGEEQRADGAWACVTIVDRGPGIAPELLPRIFERFTRGKGGGLGLGLYLARELVTAHGGTLTVRSAPEKGTRFEVRLPLEVEA